MNAKNELTIDKAKEYLKEVKLIDKEIIYGLYCRKNTLKGVLLISKARGAFVSVDNTGKVDVDHIEIDLVKSVDFHFGDYGGKLDISYANDTKVFDYGLQNIREFQKTVEEIFEEILSIRKLKEKVPINSGHMASTLKKTVNKAPLPQVENKSNNQMLIIIGTIIAILIVGGLTVNFFFKRQFIMVMNSSDVKKSKKDINEISDQIKGFYIKNNKYPDNIFADPYTFKKFIFDNVNNPVLRIGGLDPWKNPYRINPIPGNKGYTLISDGPDKTHDTEDDIKQDYSF
jgi:hypothetical protein